MSAPMSSAMTRLFFRLSRHVALHDAQRQPFGDRRLADARLADEHGIVLRAPREHLNHAANFLIAADDRIELALPGPLDQVDAVLLQRLELAFGVLIGARAPTRGPLCSALEHLLLVDRVELEHVLALDSTFASASSRCSVETNSSFISVGFAPARLRALCDQLLRHAAAARRRSTLRQVLQLGVDDLLELRDVHADLVEHRPHDALGLAEQRRQQMQRLDLRIPRARRQAPARAARLLGL